MSPLFAVFPETDPYKQLSWKSPYKDMGMLFRAYSIMSLVYALFSAYGILHNINIMGIVGLLFLMYQILFVSNAKKAAREFNRPVLSQFGTFIILSLVLHVVSIGINITPPIYVFLSYFTTGSFYLTPYSLASAIVEVCSIALQLKAWFSIATFFQANEVPAIRARGMKWTKLLIAAFFIQLGEVILLAIPLALIISVIDNSTASIIVPNSAILFEEIDAASLIFWGILTLVGYFKVGGAFLSLETSKTPE